MTEPNEQTLLELSTASLIPQEIMELLTLMFGKDFGQLTEFERMIVVTAAVEGWVNHERACQLTSKHSRDVTLTLPKLVDKGFLVPSGEKRHKSYSLPGMKPVSPEEVFSGNALSSMKSLTHSSSDLTHMAIDSTHKVDALPSQRDDKGRVISHLLTKPFVDDLQKLSLAYLNYLEAMAAPVRQTKRVNADEVRGCIKKLCAEQFLAVSVLEQLLDRKAQSIRQNYLKPMVDEKVLQLAFPDKPNSPKQGYTLV